MLNWHIKLIQNLPREADLLSDSCRIEESVYAYGPFTLAMERQFWPSFWNLVDGSNKLQEIP